MRTVYLDLETTGLNPSIDEILEIGILDDDGRPLVNTLVRPTRRKRWAKAQQLHGIAPADVKEAPTIAEIRPQVVAAVTGARVVIYNARFDSAFLVAELEASAEVACAMLAFAEVYGEWDVGRNCWHWQKLRVAAAYVGHQWGGAAHRAIEDCAATRSVWRYLSDSAERARIDALHGR